MKFIKKHLTGVVFLSVFLIIVLLAGITFFSLWFAGADDRYGNRLTGIDAYPLSQGYLNEVKEFILAEDFALDVSITVQGRLVNFIITVEDNTSRDTAKEIGKVVIGGFSEGELLFYDLQIFLIDSDFESEDSIFPIMGYKHKSSDSFVWSNN